MPRLDRRAAYAEQPRAVQAMGRGQGVEVVADVLGVARPSAFG